MLSVHISGGQESPDATQVNVPIEGKATPFSRNEALFKERGVPASIGAYWPLQQLTNAASTAVLEGAQRAVFPLYLNIT